MTSAIKDWLDSIHLHQYFALFIENGYRNIQECVYLTESDLDDIAITLPGHRRRILANLPFTQAGLTRQSYITPRHSVVLDDSQLPPPPSGHGHRRSVTSTYLAMSGGSRGSSICEPDADDGEQIYDVPPLRVPRGHGGSAPVEDQDIYVKPDADVVAAAPPLLPKKKVSHENVDAKLGITSRIDVRKAVDDASDSGGSTKVSPRSESPPTGELNKRRPVPKPRPSVQSKRPVPIPRSRSSRAEIKPAHAQCDQLATRQECDSKGTANEKDSSRSSQSVDTTDIYEPIEVKTDKEEPDVTHKLTEGDSQQVPSDIGGGSADVRSKIVQEKMSVRPPSDGAEYEVHSGVERVSDDYELQTEISPTPVGEIVEYELEQLPQRLPPSDQARKVTAVTAEYASVVKGNEKIPTTNDLIQLDLQVPEMSERIVVGADAFDLTKEEEENLLNESLYQETTHKKKEPSNYSDRDSSYQGVWEMQSGGKENMVLSLKRANGDSVKDGEGDRSSSASFDQPPPAFTPPPLPPHYTAQARGESLSPTLTELPSPPAPPTKQLMSTQELEPPATPAIPPRPGGAISVKSRPPLISPMAKSPTVTPQGQPNKATAPEDDVTATKSAINNTEVVTCGAIGSSPEENLRVGAGPALQHLSSVETTSDQNLYASTTFPFPPRLCEKQGSPAVDSGDSVRRKAPSPPPKKENPFKDYYDETSGTYCLQGFYDDESPAKGSGWESEDTLSDGGDFHEDDPVSMVDLPSLNRQSSIPIVQVSKTRMVERSGYLYKKSSGKSAGNPIKSSFRWQKRWVVFDSIDLKYFSTNKTYISKRIVPGVTIRNVDQEIKQGEAHPFRFNVTTIDRVYTFATDDLDDLSLWTSLIMQTVLESQTDTAQTEEFPEGGDMHRPDKEGFVKMEGAKGKRYVTVKKDKMCYYNTYNDFQAASPIHVIEMKLAAVKEVPKNKTELQLVTPYASYVLDFDSQEECILWKESFEEAIAEGLGDDSVLNDVYENHSNRMCADCGAPDPHWASINLAITICKKCAGIHRSLSVQISKVRSLRMDFKVWSASLIQLFNEIGNDNSNNFWEWNSTEEDRVDSDCDLPQRRKFICDKYKRKKFFKYHPLRDDQTALNEALCKSVRFDDVLESHQLVFSGADVLHVSPRYGPDGETPLSLAKAANQVLQMEFLYHNGAEGSGNLPLATPPPTASVLLQASQISYRGYLHKTGSNLRSEFLRRYVVLEHNIVSYYESEQSKQAKDSIEKADMMSVAATTDDRFEFTFELATVKSNGRVYLFAADTLAERQRWVNYIAKTITTVPDVLHEDLSNLDRGGLVFLRDGASGEYQKCWIHVRKRKLFLFSRESMKFEDIDLLKIKNLKMLTGAEDSCRQVLEHGAPFVIDLKNRALYIQADLKKETEEWHRCIRKAALEGGSTLAEQQLTNEDIPVIVDKCINFVETHGLKTEGIYRLNGQHMKVTKLLQDFCKDALGVHLRLDTTNMIHDVCTTLKRFFRNLEDPLLTGELHSRWIATALMPDEQIKLRCYEDLLVLLPSVNYATLRKLILHLVKVTSNQDFNKMSSSNLASIFGPILITVNKPGDESPRGYGGTSQEIAVLKDLIDHQSKLFEVKTIDREKERAIAEAMQKIRQLNDQATPQNQGNSGDLLIAVYVNEKSEEQVVTLTVSKHTTALQVQQKVLSMRKDLSSHGDWGLFEVICSGDLQRPIHYNDKVQEISLKWSFWPQEFSRDNHFCLKENFVYKQIEVVCDSHFSLFGELRFSEKKGFKRYSFEFSQAKLIYSKEKANVQLGSWNVEDLVIYLGCQASRRSPGKHTFTFISKDDKEIVKTRDSPFFGYSVCCHNEEELYRWIAAMLRAQHPEGLIPSSADAAAASNPSQVELDTIVPMGAGTKKDKHKSMIHKWLGKAKR